MLWDMTLVAVTFMAAGAELRDFISKPNWWDAIWFVLFIGCGIIQLLALIGVVMQDVKAMSYV